MEDFITLLRSKTALGRLAHDEVKGVLDFLEAYGLKAPADPAPVVAAAPVAPVVAAPVAPIAPPPVVAAPVVVPPPPVAAPVAAAPVAAAPSTVESLEAIIKKDIDAFLHPAAAPAAK